MKKYKFKKHTAEEVQKMIERYEQGATLKEIGEIEDLSAERIRQLFVKADYKTRGATMSKKFRESFLKRRINLPRAELERLYVDEKKCAREIAVILNFTESVIYANLERYDIPRRPRSELNMLIPPKYPKLTRENLYQWYIEEKKPVREIAETVGCQSITIYKRLERFGIKKGKLT